MTDDEKISYAKSLSIVYEGIRFSEIVEGFKKFSALIKDLKDKNRKDSLILRSALGGTYGGPSISYENSEWVLYCWTDAPVDVEILCRHQDWDQFLILVGEYSNHIEGEGDGK